MKKVKHNQRFFIIHNEGFRYKSNIVDQSTESQFIYYQWVIPMYVYSINRCWNGEERFNLSPVNFGINKNKSHDNWRWMREFKYDVIGKEIFNTEEEAWKAYNRLYDEDQKKVFEEKRRIRFLQESDPTLI